MFDHKLVELSIELTNACNLSCLHCSSGSTMSAGKDELNYHEHRQLVREARDMGATVLSLSGGNPLLYNNLTYLINDAVSLGYERILMYTTGHNTSGPTVENYYAMGWLLDIKQLTWIFSLHSHIPSVNDYLMNRVGAFDNIVASIRQLREYDIPVEVHMVPMRPNFSSIADVRNLCASLGVSKLSLLRFVPQTRGKMNRGVLDMDKMEFADMQYLMEAEASKTNHPVQLRMGCPIDFRHMIGMREDKAKPCHAGDDLMLVRPTGAVHPCAAWKSLPADSNVRKSSLSDIWSNSEVFNAIRKFKDVGYKEVGGCESCQYLHSCKGGCPAQRLHAISLRGQANGINGLMDYHSDPLCMLGDS